MLEACLLHNIKKVVVTSSIAATMNKHMVCDENSWYPVGEHHRNNYATSKVLAEREAWRIYFQSEGKLNLTVINPGIVLGKYHSKIQT